MINIEIISYNYNEHSSLMQLIKDIFPDEQISQKIFNEVVLCNIHFNPNYIRIAKTNNAPVGCIIGTCIEYSHIGYIQLMGVLKDYRGQGIGSLLLQSIRESMECSSIRFCDYPYNYIIPPGLDKISHATAISFLQTRGFKTEAEVDAMKLNLISYTGNEYDFTRKSSLSDAGYEIKLFDNSMFPPALIMFCQEKMQRDWLFTLQRGYFQQRLHNSGYVCIEKSTQKIIGFAFFWSCKWRFMSFWSDWRRFRIPGGTFSWYIAAKLLPNSTKRNRFGIILFLWCNKDTPAWYMYSKLGFKVFRTFNILKRKEE